MTRHRMAAPAADMAQQILQVIPRLNRWAETRVSQSDEGRALSLRQLSALSVIREQSATLGDVARRLMVTPAVVTGLIDRLERRGYVRRISGSEDRRRVHLAMTDEGLEASRAVEQALVSDLSDRLASLSPEEIRTLEEGLAVLERLVKELSARSTDSAA